MKTFLMAAVATVALGVGVAQADPCTWYVADGER